MTLLARRALAAAALGLVLVACGAGNQQGANGSQSGSSSGAVATTPLDDFATDVPPDDSVGPTDGRPGAGATVVNLNGAAHITGPGTGQSTPFLLAGANQQIDWTTSGESCTLSADVVNAQGQTVGHLEGENGQTIVRGVADGSYTVNVTSNCSWILDIQPA